MKHSITKLPYDRVHKLELPDIVKGTLAIVATYNPEELHIDGMYKLLLAEKPNLERLSKVNKAHPLTKQINGLRKECDSVVVSILEKSRSIQRLSIYADAAKVLVPVVNSFFSGYIKLNRSSKTECITQFLKELENISEVSVASELTGMKVYVDELKDLMQNIHAKTGQRRVSSSSRTITNRKELRINIFNATSNLYHAIELAKVEYPNVDYMPLINELNKLLVPYKSIINTRKTLNRKASAKTKTVASSSQTIATAI